MMWAILIILFNMPWSNLNLQWECVLMRLAGLVQEWINKLEWNETVGLDEENQTSELNVSLNIQQLQQVMFLQKGLFVLIKYHRLCL